jgi:hypothetical protein
VIVTEPLLFQTPPPKEEAELPLRVLLAMVSEPPFNMPPPESGENPLAMVSPEIVTSKPGAMLNTRPDMITIHGQQIRARSGDGKVFVN